MRVTSASPLLIRAALAALTLGLVAACSQSTPAASPSARPDPPAAATSPAGSSPASVTSCDNDPWRDVPVSVSHSVAVPPVPVVTAITVAGHPGCGYDRLVLTLSGKTPSYTIRSVGRVVADASGKPIALPGTLYLLITLRPTQAHKDSGVATVRGGVVSLNLPTLAGYALAGDFEGVVTVAVGLRGKTGIRVGELPGRVYVDFQN
jgi:hypothetical protein